MVKTYSEDARTRLRGGELNWFSKHRVPEKFANTVFNQKKGQLGNPFQTDIGWHIVEITDRQAQRLVSYEEVKDELYTYLTNAQRKDAVTLLLKKLRDSANIQVFTGNLDFAQSTNKPQSQSSKPH